MDQLQQKNLLLFPCPGCGAQMYYNPKLQQLECPHCGTRSAVEKSSDQIKENSLAQFEADAANPAVNVEQIAYKCERCGSQTVVSTETPKFTCAFCGYEAINPVAYKTRVIQPAGIVPFAVAKDQSLNIFKTWLGQGFWAPGDLGKIGRADGLKGIYMPFWTYDCETHSDWTGYGGRYYYVTERYTDSDGKEQTREVQHTEWIYRTGEYNDSFDDILIGGSDELPQQEYETVFPYKLEELVNFNGAYLSGWDAGVYDIDVEAGYAKAQEIMKSEIYTECTKLCTIDTYKDVRVETEFSDQTYKHLLLPLWLCNYTYRDKKYRFLINGQTGKIHGHRPVSAVKVVFAVLIALAIIILIIVLASQHHHHG